ncbi:hypothetical protein B0H12DRAFT_1241098 [Mycena haematopus]|nr:hypothetical protein B0H12DRAFT_1241098 [Mycena haematopus]
MTLEDDFDVTESRECENLSVEFQDLSTHLDPLLIYPKSSVADEVHIDYYTFKHSDRNDDGTLKATKHSTGYRWTPFKRNKQQAADMRLIVRSQPTICVDDTDVPLHVHRSAQLFHSSGDRTQIAAGILSDIRPSDTQSMIYVTPIEQWRHLDGRHRHEILRHHGVLLINDTPPLAPDGEQWAFNVGTMSAFTHPHRLAYIHDLGACLHNDVQPKKIGRPSDLIICAEHRKALDDKSESMSTRQSLNLLSNPLEGISTVFPAGWRDIATHEITMQWLREKAELPHLPPLIQEFNWAIFATASAVTWHHHDVLFTMVGIVTGEKLWFVGRRKDLPAHNHRGLLHSRHAYDRFNGWTHMTNVWDFECIHLDEYTTFYMQASAIHAVISKTDCIASGRHAIPMSNVSKCVLTTLHNVMLSSILTNADHEPARRVLLRIFALFALAVIDPLNKNTMAEEQTDPDFCAREKTRLSLGHSPMLRTHTPELTSAQASELDTCIGQRYTIRNVDISDVSPISFTASADEHLITMAASLIKYHEATYKREDIRMSRPENFTPTAFTFQMLQAVARFDLHRQWYLFDLVPDGTLNVIEPLFLPDQLLTKDDMAALPLSPNRRMDTIFKQIQPWLDNTELLQLALLSYTPDVVFGLALWNPLIWQAAATLWLSTTPKSTQNDCLQTHAGMQGFAFKRSHLAKMPNELHIMYMTEMDIKSLLALATAYPELHPLYALDATGAILTGAFAHHLLFTGGHRSELADCCTMDLYVYGRDNFSSLIKYFIDIAPYVLYHSEIVRAPSMRKMIRLRRKGTASTGLDIVVHFCTARPQAVVMRQAWTSNFSWFSGREVFVAYPELTFRSLTMLSHHLTIFGIRTPSPNSKS